MKVLNAFEIENLVQELRQLLGARLQEVRTQGDAVALGLFLRGHTHWLHLDMNPALPMMLLFTECRLTNRKTPINLFLSAHGRALRLTHVLHDEGLGRVVQLTFGNEPDPLKMEIRLFPHGTNIIAKKSSKIVSSAKIKSLPVVEGLSATEAVRSNEEIRRQWLNRGRKTEISPEAKRQKQIQKMRVGLEKLKADLEQRKVYEVYGRLGEWLKTHQRLDAPPEFKNLLQENIGLAGNIEMAFAKAKSLKRKFEEGRARLQKLEKEILEMPRRPSPLPSVPKKKAGSSNTKYRTLKLNEKFEAYMGKSALDNLGLLREAQAWDLWLHLRDQPGAHVIIRRPKGLELPKELLEKVVFWLVEETASNRFQSGDFVEVQIQEARFVRPLKGSPGRVTVQNPKYKRLRLS